MLACLVLLLTRLMLIVIVIAFVVAPLLIKVFKVTYKKVKKNNEEVIDFLEQERNK
jgi:hypothetical protein